ncbi:MAG: hypothetical protein A3H70_03555 [Candidatus Komeilibacteria bacterium RIFCSPLOWO2_02_FULL_48_11]|uniref:Nucleotidyltransferase n=1 Tax=Candidatus Komeilibacteria bacterium RIFCSPLOWO2_02_FULL_48_11 TaxID=1798553 RepID=A0A1G2BVN8_9BACT|nr:MAG: hypothetical protein A3H70_03555 [Candidatus Komeilibacteria bacterium RIFCSPLOWO2_02_FULL_48_11]
MNEIIASFGKSLQRLEEVLQVQKTIIARDAAIQRFEFTVELAWKSIQQFLRVQNIVCRSPKQCLEEAFKFGLVADNPLWLKMMEDRNLTVHTYNEETAEKIYSHLKDYLEPLGELREKLEKTTG